MRLSTILVRVTFLSLTGLLMTPQIVSAQEEKSDADYYELMKTFVDTFEQIERNYVEGVDRKKLVEAAIRGMLKELDPYSSYISPEDLTRFEQDVEQKFGGIGIQVAIDPTTKRLTVMTPLPGTPAYRAGVKSGDTIMEIEGKSTRGMTMNDAVKLLKGDPGEGVTIGVRHLGSNKIEKLTIVRDIVEVATVMGDHYHEDGTWEFMLDDEKKIGYIRLSHFSRRSAEEMEAALEELSNRGMKSLILDLRNNPGGLLSQAVAIADLFLEKGRIVSTKGRNSPERVWDAQKDGTFTDFKMVVMVNRFSASASEILSAALQDHKRAEVVGERTWGKGSVQNVIELQSGDSALKLTTAGYHRPSGKNIHRVPGAKETDVWGVMPTTIVKFSTKQLQDYLDYRRKRDVIKANGPPASDYKDAQMQASLDFLEGKKNEEAKEEKPEDPNKKAAALQRQPNRNAELKQLAHRAGLLQWIPSVSL